METAGEITQAKGLILDYLRWLDMDLSFQEIDAELAVFPGRYNPPEGAFIVAKRGGAVVGCVGIKKLEEGICEMKRLFVRDDCKGKGVGQGLVETIIRAARERGYKRMRLDTLSFMERAIRLYRAQGFYGIGPYYNNPCEGVIYLEKLLEARHG
ncbi:MAG: GNAT family N-acetyltransferase [Spirochaetaceae bacterium]|jgi:ribosomal protein S18 acetylase RimI-like enzyme|nr:GNAT family N-acetyltransferase [Spirochaetaceae bacterium]